MKAIKFTKSGSISMQNLNTWEKLSLYGARFQASNKIELEKIEVKNIDNLISSNYDTENKTLIFEVN
jgi:hypothetical protein